MPAAKGHEPRPCAGKLFNYLIFRKIKREIWTPALTEQAMARPEAGSPVGAKK
jgi:hypothetical protein